MEGFKKFCNHLNTHKTEYFLFTTAVGIVIAGGNIVIDDIRDRKKRRRKLENEKELIDYKYEAKLAFERERIKLKAKEDANKAQNHGTFESDNSVQKYKVKAESIVEKIERVASIPTERMNLIGNQVQKGEICVIVGPSKVGKTILGFQCAIDFARGITPSLLPNGSNQTIDVQQRVVYFDFELNDFNYSNRYGKVSDELKNLPLEILDAPRTPEDIVKYLKNNLDTNRDTVVFFDNKSKIYGMDQEIKTNVFFDEIQLLQKKFFEHKHFLTIFILAHPKDSNYSKDNPVSGSANFLRFSTKIVEIQAVPNDNKRVFIKSEWNRDVEKPENVVVLKIIEIPYLHLEYECTMPEEEALKLTPTSKSQQDKVKSDGRKTFTPDEEKSLYPQIIRLVNEGKSYAQVVDILNNPKINQSRVQTVMADYKAGKLDYLFTDEPKSK